MPTLMDEQAQAFAAEAPPDMSGALAGVPTPGASDPTGGVRQSRDDTVQRALLGDELTERYGDVLGLRKETWKDFFRDMGNELGRPGNAERVKQRVIDQYQTREREERLAAQERDQEDRLKLQGFFDLIGKVKEIPKGHRKGILQLGFDKLGMEASPEVLKLIADSENFGQLEEALKDPKLIEMAFENPQAFLAQMLPVAQDPEALLAFVKGIEGMKAQRQAVQNKILEADRTRKGIEQMDARIGLMQARTEALKKGKTGAASKTPLLDSLRNPVPRTSSTPNVTVRKKTPTAGIAQE